MKATGNPKSLARKMEVSERHVYRLIKDLKDMGFPVKYCSCRNSYTYEGEVKIRFEVLINNVETLKINRGEL